MEETQGKAIIGKFWLANTSLAFSRVGWLTLAKDGATITLEGSLTGRGQIVDAVIFGVLHDRSEKITLYNSFTISYTASGEAGENVTTIIKSTAALLGVHKEKPDFYGIQFRIPESVKWFNDKIFDREAGDFRRYSVAFDLYEEDVIEVGEGLKVVKCYQSNITEAGWGVEELAISKRLHYRILCESRMSKSKLLELLRHFRRFMEFVCQAPFEHAEVSLIDDLNEPWNGCRLYVSQIHVREKKKFDYDSVLLPRNKLPIKLDGVLAKWFELKESHKEPVDRFFDAMEYGDSSHVLAFLWMVSAIEEMHKIKSGLRGKKPYLKERLSEVCGRWSGIVRVNNLDDHLGRIKDTRHYYAHGASDLRGKSAHDWALIRYSYFLKGLFNLEMLSLIGFSEAEAVELGEKNFGVREYLSLSMFPGID